MQNHEPSSLIPLHDGMVISFINYELRINLEKKDPEQLERENSQINERQQQLAATANFSGTIAASAPAQVIEEPTPVAAEPEASEGGAAAD